MTIEKAVIGDATLYCGDCREILPTIEENSIPLMFTDPPYGHNNGIHDLNAARAAGEVCGNGFDPQDPIANDDAASMRVVVDAVLTEAARFLRDDCCCCCCCCGGPRPTFAWIAERMDRSGLQFFHSVIWDKLNPGLGWRFRREHEMIMVAHRAGGRLAWPDPNVAIANVIRLSKPKAKKHPNEKPVALAAIFVRATTRVGDVVIDPFMGSGTTGVACVQLGRKFIGIDVERRYFDIACERIENAQRQRRLIA